MSDNFTDAIPRPRTKDIEKGVVLYLGKEETTRASYEQRGNTGSPIAVCFGSSSQYDPGEEVESGVYEHPILVLARPSRYSIVVALCTTLRGRSIEKVYTKSKTKKYHRRMLQRYIPITPQTTHPLLEDGCEDYNPLTLQGDSRMSKPGYVVIRRIFQIDYRDTEQFYDRHPAGFRFIFKLDQPSLERLLRLVKKIHPTLSMRDDYHLRRPSALLLTDTQRRDSVIDDSFTVGSDIVITPSASPDNRSTYEARDLPRCDASLETQPLLSAQSSSDEAQEGSDGDYIPKEPSTRCARFWQRVARLWRTINRYARALAYLFGLGHR